MAEDKLAAFKSKTPAFAEQFENNQVTLQPTMEDLAANFNKNRNEVVIGERTYVIKKFGIRRTIELVPVLGSSFLVPASAAFKGGEGEDSGISGVTESLMLLFDNMGDGRFFALLDLLLENTTFEGRAINIDEDFEDIGDVFKVCVKVLEISFSPFLSNLDLSLMTDWIQRISSLK